MSRTVKIPVRFTSVKPSPERVQQRGQQVAEQRGGTLVEVSPLRVGRNRRRSTVWDADVTVALPDAPPTH